MYTSQESFNGIFISVPPTSLTMIQTFPPNSLDPGTQIQATCQTDSGNPAPAIRWIVSYDSKASSADLVLNTHTEEVPGNYNANYSISTLFVTATAQTAGIGYKCVVIDAAQAIIRSTEYTAFQVKGNFMPRVIAHTYNIHDIRRN